MPSSHHIIIETTAETVAPLRLAWLNNPTLTSENILDDLDRTVSQHFIVTASDGTPIACATLAYHPRTLLGHEAPHRLRWLGVHPDYRGQGIGTALIQHRLALAAQAGSRYAWASSYITAVPLYESLGAVSENIPYNDDGDVPHLRVLYGPLPLP